MRLIAKNLLALLGSQVATWGASLIMLVIVPRFLGDVEFGRLSFAGAFVAVFTLVAGFGTGQFLTQEIARDRSRSGPYLFNALLLKLPLSVLMALLAIGLVSLLQYPAETRMLVAIMCIGLVLTAISDALRGALAGEQRMGNIALWASIDRYISVGAVVVVLINHMGISYLALAVALPGSVSCLALLAILARPIREGAKIAPHLWKMTALGGLPYMLWNIVQMIASSIDISMLSLMAGDAVVGWYVMAYRFVSIPVFLPTLVMAAFFPTLAERGAVRSGEFAQLTNRAIQFVFFGSAPMAIGLAFLARDIISFFRFPAAFDHSVPLMQILAINIPLMSITIVLGSAIMAYDRQKQWVIVGSINAALTVSLNLLAIPLATKWTGNGAIGAAAVMVVTEYVMLMGAMYLRPTGVMDARVFGYLARCLTASMMMGLALRFTAGAWLPWKVALGAGDYFMVSLLLRTVSARDLWSIGRRVLEPRGLRRVTSTP